MKGFARVYLAGLVVLLTAGQCGTQTAPVIESFEALPGSLPVGGGDVTLQWRVRDATSLVIDEGVGEVTGATGSHALFVADTTTYTLTATNVAGSATAQVTVTVEVPPLEVAVDPEVVPGVESIDGPEGTPVDVAAAEDEHGVRSDFVVGHILIRPKSEADLDAFLERYGGVVVGDDSIPEPPASLGITLTPEERRAIRFLVRIDLSRVDPDRFVEDAAAVGMGGVLSVSSLEGLLTLAGATNALAAGFDVSPDYLTYPQQAFPAALLRTEERPAGGGTFTDAFDTTRFQATGSQSNVTAAWQFVMAHGIARRVVVAIIDDGFWLDASGVPLGTDADFPTIVGQYDFPADDYVAAGPGTLGCGAGNPCFWHGTGAAGVAVGVVGNRLGDAGTGGIVADVMLFKRGMTRSNDHRALRTAVAWGADVVSMSFGGDCDSVACREFDRDNTPIADAVEAGSRTVFLAAAGNDGHEVGHPFYVHPCIEDYVICVGALDDDATTKINYSNFGGRVDVFAPTNIPVMSQPASTDSNPAGPASPTTFGGTSASTPFVAGVAAMIKAIDPELDNEDVRAILHATAHPGAGQVTRYVNAYAAVRRAAEGVDAVRDRFEPNSLVVPSQLTGAGPWPNLNLHDAQDRDYYRIDVPQRSTMRVDLAYPEPLGEIPWLGVDGTDACGVPVQGAQATLPDGGRRFDYTVAAGPHVLSLGGGLLNAYDLAVGYSAATALAPDALEPNDTPANARSLYSFKLTGGGRWSFFGIDPRVTQDANLHVGTDVDYYEVRGAEASLVELIVLAAVPQVKVYGNESPMTLTVYALEPDGSQGPLVGEVSSASCGGGELSVRLESGAEYLVRVSGGAGRYTLHNGIGGDERRIPELVRDRVYEVLNPLDPITRVVRGRHTYAFIADRTVEALGVRGAARLALYDFAGGLLDEGERLDLTSLEHRAVYALEVTPLEASPDGVEVTLEWTAAAPTGSTDNLITNGGAEEGPGNDAGGPVDFVEGWMVPSDFVGNPTVIYYNGVNGLPDVDDPGPDERGDRLFAGGPDNEIAAIQQQIDVPDGWHAAIDEGRVRFTLSGHLGGRDEEADHATLSVTFRGASEELGTTTIGPVLASERDGRTGLFPVGASGEVPPGTELMYVDLVFTRHDTEYGDGYADELALVLEEFAP